MSIKTTDVFVRFECEDCGTAERVSFNDVLISGHPICEKCYKEMECGDKVYIPELGDE